ncbi:MAG: cell division protein FtsA [Bacteroidaceae bacterium]|nr:cell division protein FtsA [Bacteroidaceae bacterium]
MAEKESIIVAIELGSSKISGIAGKMKDGTIQILAYAEEKTNDCIKRGVVYNIEKTTQSIKNVVTKLESSLKMKITRTYIGLGGQSVRSVKKVVKQNMLAPTYINQTHIDELTDQSHEVDIDDCELIGYFTQDFIIDGNVVAEPVGVMGTNLEGEFLNIIANKKLKNNINTSFENLGLDIADYRLTTFELANNILTDAEKRSGCAMIDFGAGTTTIAVLKNNVVRQIVTIPLGINNIIQDLCDLQIEYTEALQLFLTYGNALPQELGIEEEQEETPKYRTSDGREIEVSNIEHIIEARFGEILANVNNQLVHSDYASKLLGGIVITGGGANLKNIDKACSQTLKAEKIRIARKLIPQVIKNSDITSLSTESPTNCAIIALLLPGGENCVGEAYNGPDIFRDKEKEDQIAERQAEAEKLQQKEEQAYIAIEATKGKLREAILNISKASDAIKEDGKNKKLWEKAFALIDKANNITDDDYINNLKLLEGKDKYNQSIREANTLFGKLDEEIENLQTLIAEAKKQNNIWGKITNAIEKLLQEDDENR